MRKVAIATIAILAPAFVQAQDSQAVQRLYEAGQYQQVVDAATPGSPPEVVYTAAQSYQKMTADPQALQAYDRLAALPPSSPWHFIGVSGRQIVENQAEPAAASARQAVAAAGPATGAPGTEAARTLAAAQYQLGLALAKLQRWPEAAAAFDVAAERQPSFAYAHYYSGLSHNRANRPDQMAIHFDQFLKLAPEAPERPEVLSIMRTIRRR